MLDFQKFFQEDEDEDAGEGEQEGWKKVTKGKVGEKKKPRRASRGFYKGFSRKKVCSNTFGVNQRAAG